MSSSSSEEEEGSSGAGEHLTPAAVKELQRLRQRPKGLSAEELAAPETSAGSGEKAGKVTAGTKEDEPYAIDANMGGMVDMKVRIRVLRTGILRENSRLKSRLHLVFYRLTWRSHFFRYPL